MLINKNKNKLWQIGVLVLLGMLLAGCGAIVTPSASATNTDASIAGTIASSIDIGEDEAVIDPCEADGFVEYDSAFIDQYGEADNTKYTLVLLDRLDGSSEEIEEIISFMQDDIVSELSAGDRLVMAWIEPDETSRASLILDTRVDSVVASLEDFPERPVAPTAQPTPIIEGSTSQKGMQQLAAATVESENAAAMAQYHCAIGRWNAEAKAISDGWEQEQQNNLDTISEDIRTELTDSTLNTTDSARDIYGALSVALDLAQPHLEQDNFSQYTLLLISSMKDIGSEPPLSMDLQDFDTLIVVADKCISNHPCDTRDEWQSKLQILGITPTFLSFEESARNIEIGHVECTLPDVPLTDIEDKFELDSTEYVMVLVDKTVTYSVHLPVAIELITSTIVSELESGDYILAAWIDADADENSSIPISTQIPSIDIPPITDKPSGTSVTSCDKHEWNLTVEERYNQWKREQQVVVDNTAREISNQMGTPELLAGRSIYAALSLVSDVSATHRNSDEFKRFTLFIFSDMDLDNIRENAQTSWVQDMNIDFENTNVYFIFFSCRFDSSCEQDPQKTRWPIEMVEYFGVENGHVKFLTMENGIETFLSDYMQDYDSP